MKNFFIIFFFLIWGCSNLLDQYHDEVEVISLNNYWNVVKPIQNSRRVFFNTTDLSVIIRLPFKSTTHSYPPYTYDMSISVEPMFHTRSTDGKSTIKHKVTSRYTFVPTDVYLIKDGKKQECKLYGLKVRKYALLSTTAEYPWVGNMDFLLPYAFSSLEGATIHIGGIEKDGKPIPPLEFTIHKVE